MKNFKLIISAEFADDLITTIEYIEKENLNAAKIFERNVRKKIKHLKKFPEMGKLIDDPRLKSIRILIIGNYLVLYEVISHNKLVYLHRFFHGARDYPNLFINQNLY